MCKSGWEFRICGVVAILGIVWMPAFAEVGDPTLRTDHPQYPGEGAFQEIEDCVRFAVDPQASPQDQAIGLYRWMLTHQYHLMSPRDWSVPNRVPDTADPGDYENVVYDANRGRFSYGYGLCGTVHAWNEPYWRALGMPVRRRAFPGHVNSEVYYDGGWHAFDTDMAGLLFRSDGQVAGYQDIISDPGTVDRIKPPLPHYPFAWPSDFEAMKRGWQEVAAGGNWYALYNGGYAAAPGIVHLRSGESLTRWFDPDHWGGGRERRFWHHLAGGPQRRWTFMNTDEPRHDRAESNARNLAQYCNGEFVYEPDLSSSNSREGVLQASPNIAHRNESPRLYSQDGEAASIVFGHYSPYVICGRPDDGANPMTGRASQGLIVEGRVHGDVAAALSNDGQMWREIELNEDSDGMFRVDLTELVKGRYGWRIQFNFAGRDGIHSLKFTTVTQVAQGMYPRLTPQGCEVRYECTSRAAVELIPDFSLPEQLAGEKFEVTRLRSNNLKYMQRGNKQRLAYQADDAEPAEVVFRLSAPSELLEVRAAARYQLSVPPPSDADYRLEVSTDDGLTWTEFARSEIPDDNEFSSGWLSGTAAVADSRSREALIKVKLDAGTRRAGLIDVRLFGVHRTTRSQPVTLEFGWVDDNDELRTHTTTVSAGVPEATFVIPTASVKRDAFVRIVARP